MKKRLQSPNKFNAVFKGRLFRNGSIYNLELEDGTIVYTYLDQNLYNYLYRNKIDLDKWYTWRGQFTTSQDKHDENLDVLKVIKLTSLERNREPEKYFSFVGFCFQIQNNQITKYNKEYNFLLVNLFKDGDKESIKLCYKELEHKDLEYTDQGHPYLMSNRQEHKPVRFTCYQSGNNIVIKEIDLLY